MPEPGAIAPDAAGQGTGPAPASASGDPDWDGWDSPPREPAAPVLHLDGFDGPIDLLLDLAERQRIDLGRSSIRELAEQFVAWPDTARRPRAGRAPRRLAGAGGPAVVAARPAAGPGHAGGRGRRRSRSRRRAQRIADQAFVRAATAWLQARPQLGHDMLARPHPAPPRAGGYVALLEACLVVVVLRAREGRPEQAPLYRPAIPDLWRVTDALARIRMLLDTHPDGGALAAFLPPIAKDAADRGLRVRAAVAGSLAAALQLARDGNVALAQAAPFAPITLHAVTRTILESDVSA